MNVTLEYPVQLISIQNNKTTRQAREGGHSSEFLVGVCRPVLQILTQFQTKIFNFPHPFSDLASKIQTRFQTFVVS